MNTVVIMNNSVLLKILDPMYTQKLLVSRYYQYIFTQVYLLDSHIKHTHTLATESGLSL